MVTQEVIFQNKHDWAGGKVGLLKDGDGEKH